ncbi:MAG: hypothetical protein U0325_23405 [Polyangiales bacterium]
MKSIAIRVVSITAVVALAGVALADPPAPSRPTGPTQVTVLNLVTGSPTVAVAIRRSRTDPGTVVIPSLAAGARGTFAGEPGLVQVAFRPSGAADAGTVGQPMPWMIPAAARVHAIFSGARGPERATVLDLSDSPAPPAGQGLLRFVNLVTDVDAVDLCAAGATPAAPAAPIWMNTALGFAAAMPDGTSGRTLSRARVALGQPQRWQVRQWADPPCSGRVIARGEVTLAAASPAVIAVAQGSATGTAALAVVLCPEGAGDCRTVPFAR